MKPGNVLLTKAGVKVLDFGLAANKAADDGSNALTIEGTFLGTLPYSSPEHLEGGSADARSDIFAFGAVAYEMITGVRAFRAASQAGLISTILKDVPRPIVDLVPDVPVGLAQTVSRCLANTLDVEVMTPHYRGAHAAAKSGSGFRLYFTAHAGGGRSGGRTPSVIEELL